MTEPILKASTFYTLSPVTSIQHTYQHAAAAAVASIPSIQRTKFNISSWQILMKKKNPEKKTYKKICYQIVIHYVFFFSLLFVFYRWNNTIFEHIAKNVLTSFHIRIYQRIYSTAKKNCYLKNEYKKKKTNAGYIWAA